MIQAAAFYYVAGATSFVDRLHTERVFRVGTLDEDKPFRRYVLVKAVAESPGKHDFVSTVSGPLTTAK